MVPRGRLHRTKRWVGSFYMSVGLNFGIMDDIRRRLDWTQVDANDLESQ